MDDTLPQRPAVPHLRPLTLLQILDRSFSLYRRRFLTFVAILAVVYVPIELAVVAFYVAHPDAFTSEDPRDARRLQVVEQMLSLSVYGLAFTLALGATTKAVGDVYLGEVASFGRSYRALGRVLPKYLITVMAADILCFIGFIACVLPGVALSIRLVFTPSVCILEGGWGTAAMTRSRNLGLGHGWRIFALLVLGTVMQSLVNFAAATSCDELLPLLLEDEWHRWYIWNATLSATTLLVTPLFTIAWVLLYYDLRIRKEGFDLELLSRALSGLPHS